MTLAYSATGKHGVRPVVRMLMSLSAAMLLLLFSAVTAMAQDEAGYDEISVYLTVQGGGGTEMDAVIRGDQLFLPLTDLFDFLKIRNIPDQDLGLVTGFFISPESTFSVKYNENRISFSDKDWDLQEGDLIRTESKIFLRSDYYGRIFGLKCSFRFRDLGVTVVSDLELPVIREMRLEEMRKNISRLKGEVTADTVVGRNYPAFRFGMADWSVYAGEQKGVPSDVRLNLDLGAMVAGGEADVSLYYHNREPFTEKQQRYLWRYVDNDLGWMRQVMAGKIVTNATATVYDPVVGVQVTNTPTTFRRSFGEYTLTDRTEPGWTVELYVNGVLVDYKKADASGFFTFDVPLVYGMTMVKLKFYGPWGEERMKEQNIIIPYNFLPENTFEYTVSAGIVEDSLHSRYSRARASYGVTRSITVTGGAEYLSSVRTSPFMPFVGASVRVTGNMMISGEYTYGVRAKGLLTYRLPSNMQVDLNYIWYQPGQTAIMYNYLEERRASLSVPLRLKKYSAFTRVAFTQLVIPASVYTTAEWTLAGTVAGVHANLTNYGLFISDASPNIYSNLSLNFRLPGQFTLMPQAQYSFTDSRFMTSRITLEKQFLKKAYLSLSFERNFVADLNLGEVGLRYDFAFAQAGATARHSNSRTVFVEYARGSLINDRKTDYYRADNRTNVGRSGIAIVPFLDLNANGHRDSGEPLAQGLEVRTTGGRPEKRENDTVLRILNLEPYVKYFLEMDDRGFDNISWRLDKKSYAVITDPNIVKTVEVPVRVVGEASGYVRYSDSLSRRGLSRIIVNISDSTGRVVGRSLTEQDGYFSYFGLNPGRYRAMADTAQLTKLGMVSVPDVVPFTVRSGLSGDYVEGIDFTVMMAAAPRDTVAPDVAAVAAAAVKDTSYMVVHEVTRELVTITEDYYAVQFGAFKNRDYAEIMRKKVAGVLDKNVELFEEDGFWKVRITGFSDRDDLDSYIPVINSQGITEIWVITNRAVRSDWITRSREDSLAMISETRTEAVTLPSKLTGSTLQLGVYDSQGEAERHIDMLLFATEKPATVRNENGFYRVQITGITDTAEMRALIPVLQKAGFTEIEVIAADAAVTPEEITVIPEPAVQPMEEKQAEAEQAPPPAPRFILHAASYFKRSKAEKAKRKIERKLSLTAEIVEEWDSYRVVIPGFFTREEAYPWYPELAGLGFTQVYVIENQQK